MIEYQKGLKLINRKIRQLKIDIINIEPPIPECKFKAFSKAYRYIDSAEVIIGNLVKKEAKP